MGRLILWIALVGSLHVQGGCASVIVANNVMPLDSAPRGLQIYDLQDTVIGTTPFLKNSSGKRTEVLKYRDQSQSLKLIKHTCRIRWWAMLGNLALAIATPVLTIGGIAYDFLASGDGFNCDDFPVIDATNAMTTDEAYCGTAIVAPPLFFDEVVSDLIADEFIRRNRLNAGNCYRFASYEKAKLKFAYYGLGHQKLPNPKQLGWTKLRELGLMAEASHMYVLDVTQSTTGVVAKVQLYDLVSGSEAWIADDRVSIPLPAYKRALLADVRKKRWLIDSLFMLPNSVTFASRDFYLAKEMKDKDYQETSYNRVDNLPTYLSNWGLTWIDHPESHSLFDISLSIYPNLEAGYRKEKINFGYRGMAIPGATNSPGQFDIQRTSTFTYLLFNENAGITFHSPVGSLGLAAGFGGGGFWSNDQEEMAFQFAPVLNLRFDYSYFVSRDFFLFFRFDSYNAIIDREHAPISNELYYIRQWSTTALGIGYFLPEMKSVARSLL